MKTMVITLAAVLVLVLILAHGSAPAEEIRTVSPDKKVVFTVVHGDGGLTCRLSADGKEVIKSIPVAITIDGTEYPGKTAIGGSEQRSIDREIIPTIPTITDKIRESCNETLIQFKGPAALRIRACNDGAAFRWESQIKKDQVTVNSEKLAFTFAGDYDLYWPEPNGKGFISHQENGFTRQPVSKVPAGRSACVPLLVDPGGKRKLIITDVNVEGYPGLWVKGGRGASIESVFPHYPAKTQLHRDRTLAVSQYSDFLARTKGTRSYPWRAFVLTDGAGLLTSTMLYTLADPCRLKDTSWIKPGKVSWDWWNAWNITDVPFQAGINQDTYKNYIDFASANKLQYVILDEGWSVRGPDNLLKVIDALDIPKLVKYADSKNVGVILWMTSVALERRFKEAFEQFSRWGIKGCKVDFMQRDDQVMMDFCARVASEAAKHKLIVDFHGGSKPTGLQRTYPNVLTQESVLGLEQSKWSKKASPDMAVLLPFIRMAVGPMDYTPGAMDNFADAKFRKAFKNPASLGTRCHQLAMYVVFLSPLQMLADTPTKYRKNPESMVFLQAVPTTWDQTVVLHAEVGKAAALARRSGKKWFIGALTDWTPRELTFKLDFLSRGKHTLRYWSDGPKASEDATDTAIGTSTVTAGSELKIKLAPGGGYAAIIE